MPAAALHPPFPISPAAHPVDAHAVFGRSSRSGHTVWLWTVSVDGAVYLTDKTVTIRRDLVRGIDSSWAIVLDYPHPHRSATLAALTRSVAREDVAVEVRFHPCIISALYDAGAGIRPLDGASDPAELHAVMLTTERIGAIAALPPGQDNWGVIPGTPPAHASTRSAVER